MISIVDAASQGPEEYDYTGRDGHDYHDNGRWSTHRKDCGMCARRVDTKCWCEFNDQTCASPMCVNRRTVTLAKIAVPPVPYRFVDVLETGGASFARDVMRYQDDQDAVEGVVLRIPAGARGMIARDIGRNDVRGLAELFAYVAPWNPPLPMRR